ncbi:MAG: hypothetical protein IJC25_03455 [Clostridia bacterium]|nr:hypothetical protein [Clostridia bacterium]
MTSKQRVMAALEFTSPDKIPIWYLNRDTERSDVVGSGFSAPPDFVPAEPGVDEWGCRWDKLDRTMGQPKTHPLADGWHLLDGYAFPNAHVDGRFTALEKDLRSKPDRFVSAGLGITGFNTVTFLRGFENTLEDLYDEPEKLFYLTDRVMEFETGLIEEYGRRGADAVMFGDDWGTQRALMISPEMFRRDWLPRYKKQFDTAKKFGMKVFFHSCGYVWDIIGPLIDIGVDLINLNQPDIFGIDNLAREFGGKTAFLCPVDHQTVALRGTREEIFEYAKHLIDALGRFNGGFVANIEDYPSMGMSEYNYQTICEAFESLR